MPAMLELLNGAQSVSINFKDVMRAAGNHQAMFTVIFTFYRMVLLGGLESEDAVCCLNASFET